MRLTDALAAVAADYALNGKRPDCLPSRSRHLLAGLPDSLDAIDAAAVRQYQAKRVAEGAAPATVNRELALLHRAFVLTDRQPPRFERLRERNVRTGFFEDAEIEAVARALEAIGHRRFADMTRVAGITGWRRGELAKLRWGNVHPEGLRLNPGETKSRRGRLFPWTPTLRAIIERQPGSMWGLVFGDVGRRRSAWEHACAEAGVPGRLFHDLRRSAVRRFIRKGIPQVVAMRLTGHETTSCFNRYNIVSETELLGVSARLD